jgi:hypothetical protein
MHILFTHRNEQNSLQNVVREYEVQRGVVRPRRRWEYIIKIYINKIGKVRLTQH